ncbi:MAG: hypothetical protein C5B51_00835 [Terriglobia bacterium]|nr:MAG: hypothetical protein C5B51_00835 [Terriglobia bacterium]
MKRTWILLLAVAGAALAEGPALFYSKSFPGSTPAYVQITLAKDGNVEYREAPDEDNPVKFQLTAAETEEVFGLVEKAGSFKRPLEAPVKVAFMGAKTFRYENGAEKNEVKFNYTQDSSGQALADWFERMAESAQRRIDLERAAKYDKLGVVKSLLLLETSLDRKRLVAPEQYLPMLDRIAKNETYMHTAQARAADIAAAIRNPKP